MANLLSIGQFAVNNLLYGPKFQKKMLICSYKYFHLKKMINVINVNAKDLDVDFFLQFISVENEAEEETGS